jgi:hypothetical protein
MSEMSPSIIFINTNIGGESCRSSECIGGEKCTKKSEKSGSLRTVLVK